MAEKITDAAIRNAKPTTKPQKLFYEEGLFLLVTPTGNKWWRFKYRLAGREKLLSLGVYPAVSLKEARRRRDEARDLLAQGGDPSAERKEARAMTVAAEREQAATFEAVAREWHARKTTDLTPGHRKKILARLEKQLFPYIGNIPLSKLEPAEILAAVRHAEDRGVIVTARRLAQLAGQVCRYARLVGYAKYDAAAGLVEALPTAQTEHHATITDPEEIGYLLRAIDSYQGEMSIVYALRIMPYVFVRSVELRGAQWREFNFEAAEWVIPAGRMKMKRPHIVPLARQVADLLAALREYSDGGELVFPSPVGATRCISDMGLLNAVRRLGYEKGVMTIHGFRGMASTLLNEQGYRPDVIEAQLAHGERNAVRKAYNHAEYLPERRRMMQEWADHLDSLKEAKD